MSTKYPVPPHACRIWTEGHKLFIDFDGHAVQIPLEKCSIECGKTGAPLSSQLGWNTLLTLMRDRERTGKAPSIGKPGALVQYDIEAMLKTFKATKAAKPKMLIGGQLFDQEELLAFLKEEGLA